MNKILSLLKRKTQSAKIADVVNDNFSHLDYILGYHRDERVHKDIFELYVDNIVRNARKEYSNLGARKSSIRDYMMQLLDENTKNRDSLEGKVRPVVDFGEADNLTLYLKNEGLTPDKAKELTGTSYEPDPRHYIGLFIRAQCVSVAAIMSRNAGYTALADKLDTEYLTINKGLTNLMAIELPGQYIATNVTHNH
jgi:hypothetical protein